MFKNQKSNTECNYVTKRKIINTDIGKLIKQQQRGDLPATKHMGQTLGQILM